MAYLQTTCSNIEDLISKVSVFAQSLGWTVARYAEFGQGLVDPSQTRYRILTLSKAGHDHATIYAGHTPNNPSTFRTFATFRSFGAVGTQEPESYASRSDIAVVDVLTQGPYLNLYLFGTTEYVHGVIEHAAGRFRHFSFGKIIKKGTWTGGDYCVGHIWGQQSYENGNILYESHCVPFGKSQYNGGQTWNTNSIRCEDSQLVARYTGGTMSNKYLHIPHDISTGSMGQAMVDAGPYIQNNYRVNWPTIQAMEDYTYSHFNQRFSLTKLPVFCSDTGGWRYIGEFPDVRCLRMDAFAPAEEVSIGSDTWKIFPIVAKQSSEPGERSYNYALAYRKIT